GGREAALEGRRPGPLILRGWLRSHLRMRSRLSGPTDQTGLIAGRPRLRSRPPYGRKRCDFPHVNRDFSHRCRSSVVEHSLGKGEVVSSILTGSTTKILMEWAFRRF